MRVGCPRSKEERKREEYKKIRNGNFSCTVPSFPWEALRAS